MINDDNEHSHPSRRRFLRNAGVAGGVAWAAPQIVGTARAHAQVSDPDCIVIDDFTVAQLITDDQAGGPQATPDFTVVGPTTSIIGGQRTANIEVDEAFIDEDDAFIAMADARMSFATGFNQTAKATISYANGPLDLSPATKIKLRVGVDARSPVKITLALDGIEISKSIGDTAESLQFLTWDIADFGVAVDSISDIVLTVDTTTAGGARVTAADAGGECFFACP